MLAAKNKPSSTKPRVESIDLDKRQITLTHAIGRQSQPNDWHEHKLKYDYLVIALGSENNFFKMSEIQKHSFTMKNNDDAIILRNHIINILEQANLEEKNKELSKSLLTPFGRHADILLKQILRLLAFSLLCSPLVRYGLF